MGLTVYVKDRGPHNRANTGVSVCVNMDRRALVSFLPGSSRILKFVP